MTTRNPTTMQSYYLECAALAFKLGEMERYAHYLSRARRPAHR